MIGDYGSCNQDKEQQYSWRIDWGDGEVHEKKLEAIGPYQSTHTYVAVSPPLTLPSSF